MPRTTYADAARRWALIPRTSAPTAPQLVLLLSPVRQLRDLADLHVDDLDERPAVAAAG